MQYLYQGNRVTGCMQTHESDANCTVNDKQKKQLYVLSIVYGPTENAKLASLMQTFYIMATVTTIPPYKGSPPRRRCPSWRAGQSSGSLADRFLKFAPMDGEFGHAKNEVYRQPSSWHTIVVVVVLPTPGGPLFRSCHHHSWRND